MAVVNEDIAGQKMAGHGEGVANLPPSAKRSDLVRKAGKGKRRFVISRPDAGYRPSRPRNVFEAYRFTGHGAFGKVQTEPQFPQQAQFPLGENRRPAGPRPPRPITGFESSKAGRWASLSGKAASAMAQAAESADKRRASTITAAPSRETTRTERAQMFLKLAVQVARIVLPGS